MGNKALVKMTILGTVLMFYGGVNYLRKNEHARNIILSHLSKANQEKFMDILVPKNSGPNIEQAKTDLKKIRSYDENCMEGSGDHSNCRFADTPQLEEKMKMNPGMNANSPFGKAMSDMVKIEKAKFEQFKKIDALNE